MQASPSSDSGTAYQIGSHTFHSRLIIGSGKYESFAQNLECAEARVG